MLFLQKPSIFFFHLCFFWEKKADCWERMVAARVGQECIYRPTGAAGAEKKPEPLKAVSEMQSNHHATGWLRILAFLLFLYYWQIQRKRSCSLKWRLEGPKEDFFLFGRSRPLRRGQAFFVLEREFNQLVGFWQISRVKLCLPKSGYFDRWD